MTSSALTRSDLGMVSDLEVDYELEFGRVLHRQVAHLGTAKNAIHVRGRASIAIGCNRPIAHQASPIGDKYSIKEHPRQLMLLRQADQWV